MKKPSGFPLLILIASVLLMSSCVTQKQVKYLQRQQESDTSNFYKQSSGVNYKIKPDDNLYIKVYSLDEKSNMLFNRQYAGAASSNDFTSDASIYLNSYSVNDSGYVDFPLAGNVKVGGMNIEQAKNLISEKMKVYLKDATVVVKLVNFKITIVGEVRNPGEIKLYQDQVNIFEALSLAGDITDFGDRSKIALVRKTKEGSKVIYLDLNSVSILNSGYYYLMPNDILYVAPLGIKRWGSETFPWALVFGAITTALLLLNYFK